LKLKVFLAVAVTTSLAGCAGATQVYEKEGVSISQYNRDKVACAKDSDVVEPWRGERVCMKAKGYTFLGMLTE